jgi:tRNA modification GTPase
MPDLHDTIVALSSASGPGGRAVVRLSGPDALRFAAAAFTAADPIRPHERRCYPGSVRLPGVAAALPADLHVWPGPATYTGQQLVELHILSSPPLVELLIARLLDAGARAAGPGEFTLRAFLSGKLDLTQAEAVLGVIEAGSRPALRQALAQLAGGITGPLQELRGDLLDLLADVEAGLDFAEEDIRFVGEEDLLKRLGKGLALITLLGKQLAERSVAGATFRVVLAGPPNAGKTSLFNALAGTDALVSPQPGTTRDYLVARLDLGGVPVELADTAGWQETADPVAAQAQNLAGRQARQADLVLICEECGPESPSPCPPFAVETPTLVVATKCDRGAAPPGVLATSVVTGAGLEALREVLVQRAAARSQPPLAPSLSRCRHHVDACLAHLRQAHATVLYQEPPELLALELRGALDQLGEMVGAVYTDDLLDRIFSRFCIGK